MLLQSSLKSLKSQLQPQPQSQPQPQLQPQPQSQLQLQPQPQSQLQPQPQSQSQKKGGLFSSMASMASEVVSGGLCANDIYNYFKEEAEKEASATVKEYCTKWENVTFCATTGFLMVFGGPLGMKKANTDIMTKSQQDPRLAAMLKEALPTIFTRVYERVRKDHPNCLSTIQSLFAPVSTGGTGDMATDPVDPVNVTNATFQIPEGMSCALMCNSTKLKPKRSSPPKRVSTRQRILNAVEHNWTFQRGGANIPHLRAFCRGNGLSEQGDRQDLICRIRRAVRRSTVRTSKTEADVEKKKMKMKAEAEKKKMKMKKAAEAEKKKKMKKKKKKKCTTMTKKKMQSRVAGIVAALNDVIPDNGTGGVHEIKVHMTTCRQ
jgi:hypothetical protein